MGRDGLASQLSHSVFTRTLDRLDHNVEAGNGCCTMGPAAQQDTSDATLCREVTWTSLRPGTIP
jgi:hypothetical protein